MAGNIPDKGAKKAFSGLAAALIAMASLPLTPSLGAQPSEAPPPTKADDMRDVANSAATNAIPAIFRMARESAKTDANVDFFGFYTGMPEGDAHALAAHYGLGKDQWSCLATPKSRRVYLFKFVPRAVRMVSGGGKKYAELVQAVSNRVSALTAVDDGSFFLRYQYESSSGTTVQMSKMGGLVISNATHAITADAERREIARMNTETAVSEMAKLATDILAENMVEIPGKTFHICKHEVSQALWYAATGEIPSRFKGGELPVESVSWDDCGAFLEKLNALPEVKASGFTYRLPTAEEWECACRAGGGGDYCLLDDGAEVTPTTLKDVSWYGEDRTKGSTHPVGQKKPNAFGLYDMHGNVWEWVADADGDSRTVCGGGWRNGASTCTAASTFDYFAEFRRDDIGLRLAADYQKP